MKFLIVVDQQRGQRALERVKGCSFPTTNKPDGEKSPPGLFCATAKAMYPCDKVEVIDFPNPIQALSVLFRF